MANDQVIGVGVQPDAAQQGQTRDLSMQAAMMAVADKYIVAKTFVNAQTYLGNGLWSPNIPVLPVYPEEQPRLFEYRPGVNLIITPRVGYNQVLGFPQLRAIAASCKELRLNIELIKRQIRGMEWEITPKDEKSITTKTKKKYVGTPPYDGLYAFWESPDGLHDFDSWLNILIEEILVTDALTLAPTTNAQGKIYLEIVDGATIRPVIDFHGRIPDSPDPAYVQVLHGRPSSWFARDKILYKPMNSRSYTPYGETPAEWILTSINTSIRRDVQRIGYFTEGNIPGAFGFVPPDWTPDQIKTFQEYIDALLAGDINRIHTLLMLPGGPNTAVHTFQGNDMDKVELDDWLMRIACYACGNSPSEFGIMAGGKGGMMGSKGSSETQQAAQYRSMIYPLTGFLGSLFTTVHALIFKEVNARFRFTALDPVADQVQQATVDAAYIPLGIYGKEFVQDRESIPQEYRNVTPATPPPTVVGGQKAYQPTAPLPQSPNPVPPQFSKYVEKAMMHDIELWRKVALRAQDKGWDQKHFQSEVLDDDVVDSIFAALQKVATREDINSLFDTALQKRLPTAIHRITLGGKVDPLAHYKDAAEQDTSNALKTYFAGLRARIVEWEQTHVAG
jgi:hypothetical protein